MGKNSKDGVRQRKKTENTAANGEGDAKPAPAKVVSKPPTVKSAPVHSNGRGMTCMNWFIVLFFIIGIAGGASFFIYNEMTVMNKVLLKEIERLQSKSSDLSEIQKQLKDFGSKLETVKELKQEISAMQEKEDARSSELKKLSSEVMKSWKSLQELSLQVQRSTKSNEGMKEDIKALQAKESNAQQLGEIQDSLKQLTDKTAVSQTNVESLTSELMRLDKKVNQHFQQTNSIQQEVIDLTADKMAMNSAIESIKTTIVSVRDTVKSLQKEPTESGDGGAAADVKNKIQELDQKVTNEIARLTRQVSETSENSAAWLQQSTNNLAEKFQRSVEDITKQFNEVKVKFQQPSEATADEAVVNSIASLNKKLNDATLSIDAVNKFIEAVEKRRRELEDYSAVEFEKTSEGLSKLTQRVMEVKSRDEKLETAMDALTKQVTSLSNDLNGIKTTARILETRMEEIKTNKPDPSPQPGKPEQVQDTA